MEAPAAKSLTFEEAQALTHLDDALKEAVERVTAIDLTSIRALLVREEHWTEEQCDDVEGLYRSFLALCIRYPNRKICPNGPVDTMWHAHILDTVKYAEDCTRLFGETLHHFPHFGTRGPEDKVALEAAFADTVDLYIRHFGVDPTSGDSMDGSTARSCRPQRCP